MKPEHTDGSGEPVQMTDELEQALARVLIAWGDDELVLGHRSSEWCGHAPILEEDIAFANLALDEIGHAVQWYTLAAELLGEDPAVYPDRLVYNRKLEEYRCIRMVELPKGDWAFTMLRQFFFDAFEISRLDGAAASAHPGLAAAAAKVRKEELYHLRHTSAWVRRLGLGTSESHRRMQRALDELWGYTGQLFAVQEGEMELVQSGWTPSPGQTEKLWQERVVPMLEACSLEIPDGGSRQDLRGREQHTPHLKLLLGDLQSLEKLYPGKEW